MAERSVSVGGGGDEGWDTVTFASTFVRAFTSCHTCALSVPDSPTHTLLEIIREGTRNWL